MAKPLTTHAKGPRARRRPLKTDRVRPGSRSGEAERIACRRAKAMALRIEGQHYRQIAEALGVAPSTAYEDVQAEMLAV